MSGPPDDWDPRGARAAEDQGDQYARQDRMREKCPVAFSDDLGWSLFRHADVSEVARDPVAFSNVVSTHLSIPDGMDPPEHTRYRALIDPYFTPERLVTIEDAVRDVAARLIEGSVAQGSVEAMHEIAEPFASAVLCLFMGWSLSAANQVTAWVRGQQAAAREYDRLRLADLAAEFDTLISSILSEYRAMGDRAPEDTTTLLLRERVDGRLLREEEIASILRNWVAGEVGTVAAAAGIIIRQLAQLPDLQATLRSGPHHIPAAVDELLRLHGPLVASRRVATTPVDIGGRHIATGERVTLMWLAADRDPDVFHNPTVVELDRDNSMSLLYGSGIHACPGAPLARMVLRVLVEELLARTAAIEPTEATEEPATFPAAGWVRSWVRLGRARASRPIR